MAILCEPNQAVAARLIPALGGPVRTVATLPDLALAMAHDPTEKVVVIGTEVALAPALSFSGRLRNERPDAAVILVRDRVDPQVAADATRAGVQDVVPSDYPDLLTAAFERAEGPGAAAMAFDAPTPTAQSPLGRTIVVFAAKGGCGKTTTATNLAVALAASGSRSVCLVDLDLSFGDVAISMRLAPHRTLADAVKSGLAIVSQLDDLLTPYSRALDCVLAPVEPADAERIPATLVAELLVCLQRSYDHIVVDTPAQFSEHVLAALDLSHHQVLLTTPEIPALKNLRLTLDTLDLLSFRRDARTVVLNQADARGGLTAAEVVQALRHPVDVTIPSSHDVLASINRGKPIVDALPDHPVSKAISDFATRFIEADTTTEASSSNRRGLRMRKRSG